MPDDDKIIEGLERVMGSGGQVSESFGKSLGFGGGGQQATQGSGTIGDYDASSLIVSLNGFLQPDPSSDANSSGNQNPTPTDSAAPDTE